MMANSIHYFVGKLLVSVILKSIPTAKVSPAFGNLTLWVCIPIGSTIIVTSYITEFFARINCPYEPEVYYLCLFSPPLGAKFRTKTHYVTNFWTSGDDLVRITINRSVFILLAAKFRYPSAWPWYWIWAFLPLSPNSNFLDVNRF